MVTVLGRPGQDATQVEKSPRLNWATQLLTVAYDGACSPSVSEWREFPSAPFLVKKKIFMAGRAPYCSNRARRLTFFLSASVKRKYLQFRTRTDHYFQRHYRFRPTTLVSNSG